MKYIITLLIFGCMQFAGVSQSKFMADTAAAHDLTLVVAQHFLENEVGQAVDKLAPFWPIPEEERDAFETKTKEYLNLYNDRFGKALGFFKLKEQTISDIAIRETFLLRYEVVALRLIFTYYRGESGWILNSFKWDDNYDEEFE